MGVADLSIIVIKGATIEAAVKPDTASDASLNPKFFVFHFLCSFEVSVTLGVLVIVFEGSSKAIEGAGDPTLGD